MEKYEFSRDDYLMYKEFFENRLNEIEVVSKDIVYQKHDKTFKDILKDKKEMSKFLKQFIGLEVKEEELEKYKSSFITKNFERRESDIIYKIKDKEIYYLIEHQSSVDKNMPKRILEYCIEIMREVQKTSNKKRETNPLIVPMVIYTGTRKWNVATDFSDTQKIEEKYKEYQIKLKYKLININEYSKEELLNRNTKMARMMLIEKFQTLGEIKEIIVEINKRINNKEEALWLRDVIEYTLSEVIAEEKEDILEIIKWEEKDSMREWLERVKKNEAKRKEELIKQCIKEGTEQGMRQGMRQGIEQGIEQGIRQGILETVKRMAKMNLKDEFIKKATGVNENEIEKIKEELEIQGNI